MGEQTAAGKTYLVALAACERRVGEWYTGFPCGSLFLGCGGAILLRLSDSHATLAPAWGSVGCVGLSGFHIHFADLEVLFE